MRPFHAILGASLLVTACSGAGAGQRIAAAPGSTSATLSLKSALIEVPSDAPSEVTVSCRGGGLCRETIAPADAKEALAEAKEDCTDRGGLLGSDACPRVNVRASCTLGGGAGPIRVFTYEEEIVSRMSDLCSTADGQFERTAN